MLQIRLHGDDHRPAHECGRFNDATFAHSGAAARVGRAGWAWAYENPVCRADDSLQRRSLWCG